MLWIGNKQVGQLWIGKKRVAALYVGAKLVWEAVSSCFGSGAWRTKMPWKGKDAWKNF